VVRGGSGVAARGAPMEGAGGGWRHGYYTPFNKAQLGGGEDILLSLSSYTLVVENKRRFDLMSFFAAEGENLENAEVFYSKSLVAFHWPWACSRVKTFFTRHEKMTTNSPFCL
jgi:hypothetical protein